MIVEKFTKYIMIGKKTKFFSFELIYKIVIKTLSNSTRFWRLSLKREILPYIKVQLNIQIF